MSSDHLFTSIETGDLDLVERILADEPGALGARNAAGLSPIMVAAYHGQVGVLDLLLNSAESLDLWEAAAVGATSRVDELLKADRALVASHSPDGFTALHLAAFFGHPTTVRSLLEAGSDVSARTNNPLGNQPIHAAAAGRSALACVRLLVDAGAAVNERQAGGYTALMSAAQNGDSPLIDLLLAAGADPGLEDDDGLSSVAHAARSGHVDIADRLLEAATQIRQSPGRQDHPA